MIQKSLALAEELQGKIEANISNSEKEFHAVRGILKRTCNYP